MSKRKWFKIILWSFVSFVFLTLIFIWFCNYLIANSTKEKLFDDVNQVPFNKVGLVLGTSEFVSNGSENYYFKFRMQAAAKLYQAGKVKYLLVSGDNHIAEYDEPTMMKNYLIKLGIPDSAIILDYAGFRTFDSVVRCKEIFGQDSVTIISQPFHNQRAVYLAQHFGITAVGFNAKDVTKNYGFMTNLREYFAKTKAVLDLYLLNTKPKFYGKKIEIK